jgi:peptidoglycan-associated lipoprotein
VLTAEARTALDHNATVLLGHANLNLEVQGHADERGTTDYNLALGQQRAQSVYDYLVGQGVGTSRLTLISYGEELPSEMNSTEQAWSLNRRAEFRITWGGDSVEGTTD